MIQSSIPLRSSASAKTRKIVALGLVLGAGLGFSAGASAGEITDRRGYESCVNAFDTKGLSGVSYARRYYIGHGADSKAYYVNAHAWENGVRVAKRLNCQTSKSGRVVLSLEAGNGQFAKAENAPLNVAKR